MQAPLFFVLARVISRDGALEQWRDVLAGLCKIAKTERYSNSYYWGYDLDGAPDTIWGLEGYYHAVGFFVDHGSSDGFKEEMRKVDEGKLLRNVQGLDSPDYDLHYYDLFGGFLKRKDDKGRDAPDSFVAAVHLWASEGRRKQLLGIVADCADLVKGTKTAPFVDVQSFSILREVNDLNLVTVYIRDVISLTSSNPGKDELSTDDRFRCRSKEVWEKFEASSIYQQMLADVKPITIKTETHRSQAFIGHIDQDSPSQDS